MNLIEDFANIGSSLLEFFDEIVDGIGSAIKGLTMFHTMLEEFDDRIVAMIDNCGSSEFDGLPVNEAIATFHYVVGDIIFYLIYLVVLYGCLWTIYKIVMIIYSFFQKYVEQLSGGISSKGQFSALLTKILK